MKKADMITLLEKMIREEWRNLKRTESILGFDSIEARQTRSAWCALYEYAKAIGIKKPTF